MPTSTANLRGRARGRSSQGADEQAARAGGERVGGGRDTGTGPAGARHPPLLPSSARTHTHHTHAPEQRVPGGGVGEALAPLQHARAEQQAQAHHGGRDCRGGAAVGTGAAVGRGMLRCRCALKQAKQPALPRPAPPRTAHPHAHTTHTQRTRRDA